MIKRSLVFFFLIFGVLIVHAQSFRIEELKNIFGKGNPLKFNGAISANSVLNAGNETAGRDPFAYFLNGSVNLNIYGQVNLPFSFSLTNSGSSYRLPASPNRLSIHPSYKWATAHIGDVTMAFSPYTLNGHQFTGFGVELAPNGWEFGIMYGRLLKAVEYSEAQPAFLPNYKRMGYGAKAARIGEKYQVSLNMFGAKDEISSLLVPPDSMGVTPMQNLTGSVRLLYKPVRFIELSGEYGFSFLSIDQRAPNQARTGIVGLWGGSNMSTAFYKAFRTNIDYVGETNRFGIGYERIDPNYRTLGAYFFTNDLENITVNAYQSFWQNKMSVSTSIGYEHDNLRNNKASATSRVVGSVSVSGNLSERINTNVSYSNFQTYTNIRSNFELINQENQLDQLDTLNFVQLSQSVNMNMNIITKKDATELHNLNVNLSYQDAANKQGGIYHPGSVTEMINAATSYTWSFIESGLSLNGAVNLNNSKILNGNTITWGPTLGVSSRLFKKKVNLSGSMSYNSGHMNGVKENEVFLCRVNTSYSPVQRHNITFGYNFQWRSALNRPTTNNSLLMAGYTCNF